MGGLSSPRLRRHALRYAFALSVTAAALAVGLLLFPLVKSTSATVFMVAIILSIRYGGTGPALAAMVVSLLATDFFLTEPQFQVGASTNDAIWLAIFAILSLIMILMAESQKRAAGVARGREASFQVTLSSIRDAVITTDRSGRVTFMNPEAESLTGRRLDEARRQPLEQVFVLLDEKSRQPAALRVEAVLGGGGETAGNGCLLVARDGTELPVEESSAPLRDDRGTVQGAVYVFRDVTARRQTENALRESSLFARVTLDALAANVCVLDEQGVISAVNKSWRYFARSHGLRLPDNGVGANYLTVCETAAFEGCEDAVAFASAIRAVIAGEQESFFREYRIAIEGKESWYIGRVTQFPGKGARRAVVTHEDITPLKMAQEQLRALNDTLEQRVAQRTREALQAQEALRQAERLAVLGQMTAVLSHESRNALQRIQTAMDLLERRLRENPDALRLIQETRRAQQDLARVHEEVQGYAAPLVLEMETRDLAAVWREAWQSLESLQRGRLVALLENLQDTNTVCRVDEFRMKQVFRNLFENSLAACTDPVQIFVRCTKEEVEGREYLRVSVRDNGPGVDEELRERVFEPFYTTKPKGTGLGMAIVKRIVEGQGGWIWVEPAGERGLEVVFYVPCGDPAAGGA